MTPGPDQSRSHHGLPRPIGRIVDSVVPTVVGAVDVDELVGQIDLNATLARVDMNALLERIDIDALLERIDLERLMARIDIDGIVSRVNIDGIMDRVDIDALLTRVDIDAIVKQADLAGIVAQSTRGITATTLDLARRQLTGVDEIVTRVAARVVRRDPDQDPDGPAWLEEGTNDTGSSISGHYAGPISRAAALLLDWFTGAGLFGLATAVTSWLIGLLLRDDGTTPTLGPPWSSILFLAWMFCYFAVPLALTGRTLGKGVVGLRVVRADGHPLRGRQAVIRVLVLPFSFVFFGLGLVGAVFGRRKRTLHDVAAGSAEVIDWGDRPAQLPSPVSGWLNRHRPQTGLSVEA